MKSETVLTDDQIKSAMREPIMHADGGYVWDMSIENVVLAGRAIEKDVLQSDEVQRLREDAGRYKWLKMTARAYQQTEIMATPWGKWDSDIDAAMEKQP